MKILSKTILPRDGKAKHRLSGKEGRGGNRVICMIHSRQPGEHVCKMLDEWIPIFTLGQRSMDLQDVIDSEHFLGEVTISARR